MYLEKYNNEILKDAWDFGKVKGQYKTGKQTIKTSSTFAISTNQQ